MISFRAQAELACASVVRLAFWMVGLQLLASCTLAKLSSEDSISQPAPAPVIASTPPPPPPPSRPRSELDLHSGKSSFDLVWEVPDVGPAPVRAPAPLPVVYSAHLSPQLKRIEGAPDVPVLKGGTKTTMRFGMGSTWADSVLPSTATPDPSILASKENIELTAVLSCSFCRSHDAFLRYITYRPGDRRSDVASFTFVPRVPGANGSGVRGTLELLVYNRQTARIYDRMKIEVSIATSGALREESEAVRSRSESRTATPPDELAQDGVAVDVVMNIVEDRGNGVMVSIDPIDPEAREKLGPLALDVDGKPRSFRTGAFDRREIEKISSNSFASVSGISLQGAFARQIRGVAVSAESQKSSHLQPSEARDVAETLANVGRSLYASLFVRGPDGQLLSLLVRQLEALAANPDRNRPLRLKIVTDSISLPWQYLHTLGPTTDANAFWGMLFSLGVERTNTGQKRNVAAQPARKLLFAQHAVAADPTRPLALKQIEQLRPHFPDDKLLVVQSSKQLLEDALPSQRNDLSAIVAFLHATSGVTAHASGFSSAIRVDDFKGPLLEFASKDTVDVPRLAVLLNRRPWTEQFNYLLSGAPLVILNACATGPSTLPIPHVSLQDMFFQLGASSVVVTEVSVWVPFGHEMGTRVLARLLAGERIDDALTRVRRDVLKEKNNPLGLLYAVYGDQSAGLSKGR